MWFLLLYLNVNIFSFFFFTKCYLEEEILGETKVALVAFIILWMQKCLNLNGFGLRL